MKTPTVFQIGKLSNSIEEVVKGLGSKRAFISYGSNQYMILTLSNPEMENEFQSLSKMKSKVLSYFGLNEMECTIKVEHGYDKTKLSFLMVSQGLEIIIESDKYDR